MISRSRNRNRRKFDYIAWHGYTWLYIHRDIHRGAHEHFTYINDPAHERAKKKMEPLSFPGRRSQVVLLHPAQVVGPDIISPLNAGDGEIVLLEQEGPTENASVRKLSLADVS